MTDKPILFSGPMVRALLEGRKTQTRRVLTPQPDKGKTAFVQLARDGRNYAVVHSSHSYGDQVMAEPVIAVGYRLWVREAWHTSQAYEDLPPRNMGGEEPVLYAADDRLRTNGWSSADWRQGRLRVGIHMPRWASRLTLIVTDVRVQRVQEISEGDVYAEGAMERPSGPRFGSDVTARDNAHRHFRALWDTLNARRGFGWDVNPWVAAYTFTVHHQNIDQMGAS